MKRSYIISTIIFSILCYYAGAQQLSTYKNYHLNQYLNNPAAAGTKPYIFTSLAYSKYWSGFNGSPNLQSFSAHSMVSEQTALGGKVFYENTGLSGQFGAELTYAMHLKMNSSGTKLGFGLSAVLSQYSLFKDQFIIKDIDDEVINNSENSVIVPDAAFGMRLYKDNAYYIDFSVYQLLNRKVDFLADNTLENKRNMHLYFGGGYRFTVNENFKLEPSVLFKMSGGYNQLDAGLKAEIKEKIYVGCYYSTNDAIVPFIGIDSRTVALGYSYGIVSGDLGNYTGGSHEIMIILKLTNTRTSLD